MIAQFSLFPEQASTAAPEVDAVFGFIFAVSAFFSALIALLLIYFAIKYRRRSEDFIPKPITGSVRLEAAWIIGPLGIALVMFFWATNVYFKTVRAPEDALEIYVVG